MNDKKIRSALISVFNKEGLDPLVKKLDESGVTIYSTGGTYDYISALGINAVAVESLTSYPSILGGRVKTLHPCVFGGILARRDNPADMNQMEQYQIPEIDMVVVDLYPFSETVRSGAADTDIIEKIDIGGISLIRAAAKNYRDVVVVSHAGMYKKVLSVMEEKDGCFSLAERKRFAAEAFSVSSGYDIDIFNYFNSTEDIGVLRVGVDESRSLRYGENPHQKAVFYGDISTLFEQLHGKEISYNNLLDIEAALAFIKGLSQPSFAVIKHNNACGLASDDSLSSAWEKALSGDRVSAFGGVIVTNREIDKDTAALIDKIFFEIIIAPGYSAEALEILTSKKNRIILKLKNYPVSDVAYRSLMDGVLWQERDIMVSDREGIEIVTGKRPTEREITDMLFANRIVAGTKSNAIVLVKDEVLIGSGTGQTSRVDAVRHAIAKAVSAGFDINGAVMASDAFFPFADSITLAADSGVSAIIQPGGSVRDRESIEECDKNSIAMVFTGQRHFKH